MRPAYALLCPALVRDFDAMSHTVFPQQVKETVNVLTAVIYSLAVETGNEILPYLTFVLWTGRKLWVRGRRKVTLSVLEHEFAFLYEVAQVR